MITNHLYRALRTAFFFLMGVIVLACGENNPEPKPETKPDIIVDASYLDIFSSGIMVEAEPPGGTFTKDVRFSTTDKWTASITGSGSTDWISVQPSSGPSGKAAMTVTVTTNDTESERRAEVTIVCGNVSKSFVVVQDGKTSVAEPAIVNVSDPTLSGITVESYDPLAGTLEITVEEGKEPKVGDILCSERTEVAPYGFMVKIVSIQDISTKTYVERRLLLAYTDLGIYEICKVAGITEPGWYPLIEKDVSCTDEDGNVIVPEPKAGPKVVSKIVPMSFSDVIKFEYKFNFSVQSM